MNMSQISDYYNCETMSNGSSDSRNPTQNLYRSTLITLSQPLSSLVQCLFAYLSGCCVLRQRSSRQNVFIHSFAREHWLWHSIQKVGRRNTRNSSRATRRQYSHSKRCEKLKSGKITEDFSSSSREQSELPLVQNHEGDCSRREDEDHEQEAVEHHSDLKPDFFS